HHPAWQRSHRPPKVSTKAIPFFSLQAHQSSCLPSSFHTRLPHPVCSLTGFTGHLSLVIPCSRPRASGLSVHISVSAAGISILFLSHIDSCCWVNSHNTRTSLRFSFLPARRLSNQRNG